MNGDMLAQLLRARGLDNPDGVTRAARLARCFDCRAQVLRGLDGDRCAFAVQADPHEVDAMGEFLAKRLGMPTYSLRRSFTAKGARIWTLDPRFQWEIAAGRDAVVLTGHRCGMQIPPTRNPKADLIYPALAVAHGEQPPF